MGDFQFLDIILLALVAGFILLRLRSVLGTRTGNEKPREAWRPGPRDPKAPVPDDGAKIIPMPDRQIPAREQLAPIPPGPAEAGLTRIQQADRGFDPAEFLGGAKGAYEMIVGAFAAGDVQTLRQFLSRDVFGDFEAAIKQRKADGLTQETTLVGIDEAEIVEADLKGSIAEVTIRFVSQLVNATRNSAGAVVAGDPATVDKVTDVWTFARDTSSRDPNWTLIATSTPN
jgi:predicted lipid-binding transport protein (Tim44 family)